ncbi:50S ribosomal protein L23 [Nanoarchaeota archaeon]
MRLIKPVSTEKAVKLLEAENKVTFIVDRRANKQEIKREMEKMFNVKVESVQTQIRDNHKVAFVKLKKENLAIDVATKLGLM